MRVRSKRGRGANVVCAALALGLISASEASAQEIGAQPNSSPYPSTNSATNSSANPQASPQANAPFNAPVSAPVGTVTAPADVGPGAAIGNMDMNRSIAALQEGGAAQQGVVVPFNRPPAQRQVNVSANASATYDSNVIRSNVLRPGVANLHKGDFIFPVGLSVGLTIPSGDNTYSLQGNVGYQFYLRNSRLSSENIALLGGYGRTFRGCHADLRPSFARGRTQLQEGGFGLSNNLQTTEAIGVSLFCNVNVSLRPFGSFNYLHAANSQTLRSYSDHDTKTFGGGIVNSFPTIGDIGVVASMETTDYTNRVASVGANQVRVKSIGVTVSRETARILQARVQVNYTAVNDGRATGSFSGLSGTALVRFVPGSRFVFSLTASRTATPSLEFASDYNLNTNYALAADAKVSQKLSGGISFSHVYRRFFGVVTVPGFGFTHDTTVSYTAGADYQLYSKISLRASIVHLRRTADNVRLNYSDTRGTLAAGIRF